MEIKKIGNFTEEEFDTLTKAGNILGSIAKAGSNGEFDELTPEAVQLIAALKEVISKLYGE